MSFSVTVARNLYNSMDSSGGATVDNYEVADSLSTLCAQWQAMYEGRKAEANRLFDVLSRLAGDQRVPFEVRSIILEEMGKGIGSP